MKKHLFIATAILFHCSIYNAAAQLDGSGNYDGDILNLKHATSGGNFKMLFHSKVNYGSDKAFLLFQDESSLLPGTASEDVRFTIGVYNDFRAYSTHSDELWFQGGGRLVQNVGSWDSELNSLIGTPSVGTTGGYEWRVNNSTKMIMNHIGNVGIGTNSPDEKLTVVGSVNVGGAGNGTIKARHLNGKDHLSSNFGNLYLNYHSNYPVIVGTSSNQIDLAVYGEVGIGGTASIPIGYKLAVDGKAIMEEVEVAASDNWPDYVFSNTYKLNSLSEVSTFITKNGHLPNIPSAKEVKENGIKLGEMNAKLLEKIEELTMYLIEQNKRIEKLERQLKIQE